MGGSPMIEPGEFTVEFAAGTRIFKEGDLGAEMFIIESGEVEIYSENDSGSETVAVLTTGDFFGEMAVLESEPRYASARAITDCRILGIDASTFDQMLRTEPEIAVRMMRKLAHRLRQIPPENRGPEVPTVPPSQQTTETQSEDLAFLRHEPSGRDFFLSRQEELTIGRLDPATGLRPDVDLEEINPDRSVSRQHAKIVRKGKELLLMEDIGAVNGTFVNGEPIRKGISRTLQEGDRLGFSTVELTFHST